MDWRKGSYIHQFYKKNDLEISFVEDIQIFMVDNFFSWYDRIFILELEYKLLNECDNYCRVSKELKNIYKEQIVNSIIKTYEFRYKDVEHHVCFMIENHKKNLEQYTGYGNYGYRNY